MAYINRKNIFKKYGIYIAAGVVIVLGVLYFMNDSFKTWVLSIFKKKVV